MLSAAWAVQEKLTAKTSQGLRGSFMRSQAKMAGSSLYCRPVTARHVTLIDLSLRLYPIQLWMYNSLILITQ